MPVTSAAASARLSILARMIASFSHSSLGRPLIMSTSGSSRGPFLSMFCPVLALPPVVTLRRINVPRACAIPGDFPGLTAFLHARRTLLQFASTTPATPSPTVLSHLISSLADLWCVISRQRDRAGVLPARARIEPVGLVIAPARTSLVVRGVVLAAADRPALRLPHPPARPVDTASQVADREKRRTEKHGDGVHVIFSGRTSIHAQASSSMPPNEMRRPSRPGWSRDQARPILRLRAAAGSVSPSVRSDTGWPDALSASAECSVMAHSHPRQCVELVYAAVVRDVVGPDALHQAMS